MQVITKSFILMFFVIVLASCSSSPSQKKLESLFREKGVVGTIVISNLDGSQKYQAYPERAKTAFLPASTFKIPNTLIALEEAVISSPGEILKWDGKVRFVEAWNQNHSLMTAFPVSCVWFYQELARRVGNETYLEYLKTLNYGNMLTGPEISRFWLDGDLRITAEEQIVFLKKLYAEDLPFQPENFQVLKEVMVVEQSEDYTLYAKTGWAVRDDGEHIWWVGYEEKGEEVWFFATNIEITNNDQAQLHKEITREALGLIGVLPSVQEEQN
ncbi:MAG: class D beta-lactamase [Candidatus Marinimicrobia bacterium]|nr:class D beta-lactamase [Candidatus Neomarinimicrobiota bacterium]